MKEDQILKLIDAAWEAAKKSYSPYSKFRVGAAILTEEGKIITGTNVENRSYGAGICAERSAVVTAISEGLKEFKAVAIVSPDYDQKLPPCGICRQFLSEFSPFMQVIIADNKKNYQVFPLNELIPHDSLTDLKNSFVEE